MLRNVQQYAHRGKAHHQRGPTRADERQRDTFRWHEAEHDAHIHEGLHHDHRRETERNERAEAVRCAHGDPHPPPGDQAEAGKDRRRPDETQFLADDREDEVGVRLGQIEELLNTFHQAAPEHTSSPHRNQGLDDLKAVAKRVRPGVPEGQQPTATVRRTDQDKVDCGRHGQQRADEVAVVQPSGKDHDDDDHQQRQHGSEVRLQKNQRHHPTDDDPDGQQRIREIVDPVHAPLKDERGKQHADEFGKLGRLNPQSTDAEPPTGTIDGTAEEHGHQRQRDQANERPDEPVVAIGPVVDAHRHHQGDEADGGPHHLFDDETV